VTARLVLRLRAPVGTLTVEAGDEGVFGLTFGGRGRPSAPVSARTREHLEAAEAALRAYFAGEPPVLPRLDLRGTAWEREVWSALLAIPWGETRTYGELAARLGRPGAARAVGGANARNPVSILVPCHRVVQAQGRLGGYGGGLDLKRWLLAHEAAHAPALRPA
jgi:methylated-DNA-[protein]-cysteine S-methyltransferase